MTMRFDIPGVAGRRERGLTLVEILVAVSILVLIMVGLLTMFNHTSKAFRGSLNTVDILEGGRTALDIITSDLEQAAASGDTNGVNVFAGLQSNVNPPLNTAFSLGGGAPTNFYIQNLFILSRGVDWNGIGFKVLNPNELDPTQPNATNTVVMGTLYRFSTNANRLVPNQFLETFNLPPRTLMNNPSGRQLSRIIDGVVHFRVLFYDTAGRVYSINNPYPGNPSVTDDFYPGQKLTFFRGEKLPGYIELELGVIETPTLERARAITDVAQRSAFITANANKVHLYRRQIPIRTALR